MSLQVLKLSGYMDNKCTYIRMSKEKFKSQKQFILELIQAGILRIIWIISVPAVRYIENIYKFSL